MTTLPNAPKDISEHPVPGSVVSPIDKKKKEADIDRKLRFYGVIQAFRQGRMPSNEQIDRTLQYVLDHSPINVDQLSPEGKKLVQDTRDIIGTARLMVQEKNADELFQSFVWHTRTKVDKDNLLPGDNLGLPVDQEKAQQDADEAVRHLRTLLSLILTNSEVRKLLSDFSIIGRDLLARGASKAANTVAPTDEQLANVDQSAPNDQFITEGGRVAGPNETPILEANVPFTDRTVQHHPRQDLSEAKVQNPDGTHRTVGDYKNQVDEVRNQADVQKRSAQEEARFRADQALSGQGSAGWMGTHEANRNQTPQFGDLNQEANYRADKGIQGPSLGEEARFRADQALSRDGNGPGITGNVQQTKDQVKDAAKGHARDVRESDDPQQEVEMKKQGVFDRMRQVRDNVFDRVPQEHKDKANDQYERSRQFFSEEYFPEERRDQFIFRGKKVIMECQKHDDYQSSIRWLLGFVEEYANHGKTVADQSQAHVQGVSKDTNFNLCVSELRTLLERFANGVSLNIVIDAVDALVDDARRDEALREWFKAVDLYIRKVLLEPGYVLEPDCNNHANRLREIGREFYDGKYKAHFDNLFSSFGDWFKAMGDDPLNHQFGEDWARLTKDLLFDSAGNLKFKPHLWNDIRKVILPQLIDQVGYIPIPRVEYSDDALDLVVENLTLQGRNLFPNIIAVEASNYIKFSPYNAITDDSHHHITLHLEHMQADMRDVAFYFKKKTGIPKMSDSGLADVTIGGEGLSAIVHLSSTKKDQTSVFKVHDIHVKVGTIKFAIRDSKHDFLYKTLKPLATGLIKRQIQKAITEALRTGLEYVDGQLVSVRDRLHTAKVTEGESRVDVLKDIFQNKKEEASVKSSESKSQFRIVSDKRNSLLSGTGHPAGWVNRAAEKKEIATHGSEWRSDAFTII